MAYQALYRTFRSQTFSEIVGQKHIVRTLQNMLRQERIYHAFLFCGPRGTGKTSLARILAKALNCLAYDKPTPTPCLECSNCVSITEGSNLDVLEIDGASNRGIDEIRELRESLLFTPSFGRKKVYIIDEVHMLTTEAFNALLKTLEEPPPHVVFIFATTEARRLPSTILSRVQRFDFRALTEETIVEHLRNVTRDAHIAIEEAAFGLIAQAADGSMRDALAILDQTHSYAGDGDISIDDVQEVVGLLPYTVYGELWRSLTANDLQGLLQQLRQAFRDGREAKQITAGFISFCRDLLLYRAEPASVTPTQRAVLSDLPGDSERLLALIEELLEVEADFRYASSPTILLELAFLRYLHRLSSGPQETPSPPANKPMVAREREYAEHVEPAPEYIPPEPSEPAFLYDDEEAAEQEEPLPVEPPEYNLTADYPASNVTASQKVDEASSLSIRQVGQKWPDLLARIMDLNPALGAKLVSAELVSCEGDKVILQFEREFAKQLVERPEHSAVVRNELERLLERKVVLQCVLMQQGAEEFSQEQEFFLPQQTDVMRIAATLFEGQSVGSSGQEGK